MKITDLLSGQMILEETSSKYNGNIQVVRDIAWGTYIKAGGLTQSGGIVAKIWRETLKQLLLKKPKIENVLILGLGGGTVAKLVSSYWVGSKIIGVDIDSKIVELGKKYMGLSKVKVEIQITDAYKFVTNPASSKLRRAQYDLILVDLYNGDKFPEKFETDKFIKLVKNLVIFDGIAIFNRLYGGDKRPDTMRFARRLEKHFKKVDYIFPQANVELICYN